MTRYVVYDVFTDRPFGGNPLAVVLDGASVAEDRLQAIALEFNFSETTFVFPPADPSHTARVRIFTPTQEIPFAGHPLIGTALALADEGQTGDLVLEVGTGPIPCAMSPGAARFTTDSALEIIATPDPALVARALSLPVEAIATDTHPPVQASVGLPFVVAELTDRAALSRAQPDIAAMREGARLHPAGMDFAILAYLRAGSTVDARMFAPLDNIPEDPATGSAAACLMALLKDRTDRLTIRQGEDMGRPSLIEAASGPDGISIAGQAVRVMEGTLLV